MPKAEEEIESGEALMVVKNNHHFTEREKDCPMDSWVNGDIARPKRLRRFEEFYGFRFAEAVLSFGDYDDTELTCKILLDTFASESPSLSREQSTQLFTRWRKTTWRPGVQTLSRNPGKSALQRFAGQFAPP
ncbi:MAG: hypothetical protein ACLS37_12130 [Alistipes sp.]